MIPCAVMVRRPGAPSGRLDFYRPGQPYYPGPAIAWRRAAILARVYPALVISLETCNGRPLATLAHGRIYRGRIP